MTTQPKIDARQASAMAIARASAAIGEFPACFWFRNPAAEVATIDDVRLIVQRLRQHGNRQAWQVALEIEQCL